MQGEFRADVSRVSFSVTKRFSRVFMQQGRVQLDADWNEQSDILLRYLRSLAVDLIGPHGGNVAEAGFKLIGTDTEVDALTDDNGTILPEAVRNSLKQLLRDSGFLIAPGRYYVDGLPCISENYIGFTRQVGYPLSDSMIFDEIKNTPGPYMVFLDVWERHICTIEDSDLAELALGGADTASRGQIVTSVIIAPPLLSDQTRIYDPVPLGNDITALQTAITGGIANDIKNARDKLNTTADQARRQLPRVSRAKMRARARMSGMPDGDCNIPPEAQFRGPENQLYRIEIHRGGSAWNGDTDHDKPSGNAANAATFKWSRDNSSLSFPILSLHGDLAKLTTLGRDLSRSLNVDDWVEVVADDISLSGRPGPLRQIKRINADELTVTLNAPVTEEYNEGSTLHPYLRRWDQRQSDGELADNALLLKEAGGEDNINWINLEDGVQIQFPTATTPANTYRSGDYWLVPARVASGDVIWPKVVVNNKSVAAPLSANGIEHYYAPLAIVSVNNQNIKVELDCRRTFPSLANLVPM